MTLTLRLYDANDTEIAWVRADPFDYEITHPNEDARGDVEVSLEAKRQGEEPLPDEVVTVETARGTLSLPSHRVAFHAGNPKDHLDWVRKNLLAHSKVDTVSLVEE